MCKKFIIIFVGILLLTSSSSAFAQEVLYTENFEAGVAKDWEFEPGWRVEQEEGNFVLSGEGHSWARCQIGQDWTDFTFRSRLKLIRGGIHLNYRVSGEGRYFIDFREDGLYLKKEAPLENFYDLAQSPTRFNLNSWHDVEIVGEGGYLQVYVDGTLQIDYTGDNPLTQGSIAFETLEESYAHIDDVEVAAVIPEASFKSASIIELDLKNIFALREQGLQLVAGKSAQEIFTSAEHVLQRATFLAEQGETIQAEHAVHEAQTVYRNAILIGLRDELFKKAEVDLEEGETWITLEQYEEAEMLFREAQNELIDIEKFIGIVKKIKEKLTNIAGTLLFPDLTVELWNIPNSAIRWIRPFPPINNTPSIVAVVVKNIGLKSVDADFSIELYVDENLTKTWKFSPVLVDEDPLHAKNPLLPGGTRVYEYDVTFPMGLHSFRWVVDTKNEISESDESKKSNELVASAVWKAKSDLADLVVEDIFTDAPLIVGQETKWKVKIKNIGKMDISGPFMTSLKSSIGVQFGAFWLDALAAGDSKIFETKQYSAHEAKEEITAIVDMSNVITETNESNNKLVKNFTTSYVDLAVTDLVIKPQIPVIHKPVYIQFTVINNGPGDATKPFKVWVMPGKVTTGLTQPILLTVSKDKLPLKAGESVKFSHKVDLCYAVEYQAVVQVDFPDPNFIYKEKNTSNNTLTKKFQLKETYYVKISKIEYNDCKTVARIHLDRSGGYWKGDVKIKFSPNYWRERTIPAYKSSSEWITKHTVELDRTHWLEVYAVVGSKIIKSSAPKDHDLYLWSHSKFRVNITSITPKEVIRGKKTPVAIKGEYLDSGEGKVWVESEHIDVKVDQWWTTGVDVTLDVKPKAYAPTSGGIHYLHVDSECRGGDKIMFFVMPEPDGTQPSPIKKLDLYCQNSWTEPGDPSPNESFIFYFLVGNKGNDLAKDVKVKIELDGGADSTTIDFTPIKAGQLAKGYWKFPSGLTKGSHYFYTYIDYKNQIKESNENNNLGYLGKDIYD